MKSFKKLISLLLAAVTILSLAAGCKNEGDANDAGATGEKGTYTVNLKAA